ncbi:DNA repair helicase [Propionigenium maris DSM 9537]|uniref:DNA repair helicase n=1 Tax=Propionigenium maris DSM 9537 TaxID=1123000 RepID=A0A9W6GJU1_9FUSO|nr:DUF3427 domain-containing protein [Propionigenium maris]GLI55465.1 DNA repair helicase [Propionigenium maris DSM 9537]
MHEELKRRRKEYDRGVEVKLPLEEYSRVLKREINRENNRKIDEYIRGGSYDKAVNFVEESRGIDLELPLRNIVAGEVEGEHRGIIEEDRLILNERLKNMSMLKSIKEELSTCDEFIFVVSFIRYSGLQLLISKLKELEKRGVRGRVLTSVYMNITEPKALRKLMEFSNIEVKIYNAHRDSFHTKAYIFKRDSGLGTAIVGSSNISHQALLCGEEWNIKVGESTGDVMEDSLKHFEKLWCSEEAIEVDEGIIERYEKFRDSFKESRDFTFDFLESRGSGNEIHPNSMQGEILERLEEMRKGGVVRALAIAATGTGKTYLSAFDVANFSPKRLLFLAHREELLRGAMATYERFFPREEMGYLTGNEKSYDSRYVFATVQTLSKNESLERYSREHFDYIVVDEFHHSAAESYMKIIDHFKPEFLLGLTATPERMDGKDILEICDYNVAGEIRLKEALSRELLVPFHYFGIADDTTDYTEIPEKNGHLVEKVLSEKLSINTRVEFILSKIDEYLYDGKDMCALSFCVDKNHARYMSEEFRSRGVRSEVILADTSLKERARILKDLRENRIEIVFTVDIFNEGIDIPQVNLLLFLRPTESSTIFIQQLGRGLRKHGNKSYVTILDFIGNYSKSFVGATAITRELGESQEGIRKNIEEGFGGLPGSSYIEFDRICQRRILDKIGSIKYTSKNYLKERYLEVRAKYDRPLQPMDFLYEGDTFERLVASFGSFCLAKKAAGDLSQGEMVEERRALELLERLDSMMPIKRPHETLILKEALLKGRECIEIEDIVEIIGRGRRGIQEQRIERAFKELAEEYKKQDWSFGRVEDGFIADEEVMEILEDKQIYKMVENRLEYALHRYEREFDLQDGGLEVHREYSRLELQILLDSQVPKGSWRAGYAVAHDEICLFITMEKDRDTEEHLLYDNYFDDQEIVQWISQNKTSHSSKVGEMFVKHSEQGRRVHIFIRRSREGQGITRNFIYLGEADYHTSYGDKPMYIKWRLHKKVPDKIFLDLTS